MSIDQMMDWRSSKNVCYQDAERSENEKGVGYDYVYLLMLLVVEGWMIDYADGCAMLSLRGYEQEQAHDK